MSRADQHEDPDLGWDDESLGTWPAGEDRYARVWRSGTGRHRAVRALAIILAAAALIRIWGLGGMPPGLQFDEAHNAIDAARLLDGESASPLFFTDNGGREPMATWLHAPMLALLGRDQPTWALRLVSAMAGLATIALLYAFVARVFEDRRLALLAAAFLATSYWHLHFSRFGIRAILAPLWTILAVWAWWTATHGRVDWEDGDEDVVDGRTSEGGSALPSSHRSTIRSAVRSAFDPAIGALRTLAACWWVQAALCGLALAGAVYSHPSGRLLPLVLIAHCLYHLWVDRRERPTQRRFVGALLIAGLASLVVFLPLGLWFLKHPEWFLAHPGDVSLAAVAERQFDGSLARALWDHALAIAGMFFIAGDPSTFHNLPDLPVFDPLSALFALAGFGIALGALFGPRREPRDRAVLLAIWMAVMLLPTLLSDRPPNYSRAIAALPVIVLLPALGLRWSVAALDLRWRDEHRLGLPEKARIGLLAGAVVVAGLWTSWHYFVTFARRTPHVYYSYDVEKQDAYAWLREQAETADVFLHPLWAEHATIAYLNREGSVRSLDATETLVLLAPSAPRFPRQAPSGPSRLPSHGRIDTLIAFPAKEADREGWAEQFASVFGIGLRETIYDAQFNPMLTTFRIRPGMEDLLSYYDDVPGDRESPTSSGPLTPETWTPTRFGDPTAIFLHGYSAGEATPGAPLPITFVWSAHSQMDIDWTLFVQLVGPEGEAWGQLDRQPAKGTWPTSRWTVGDIVIDRYAPVLDADAEGEVRVRIGWYDLDTGERLPVGDDEATNRTIDEGTALELAPIAVEGGADDG